VLTLIVNSYAERYRRYIVAYLSLVARFSDLRLIDEKDATPDYDLSSIDAVLLSGSEKYITKEEYTQDYLEFVKRIKVPLLGVCYGHQILALVHGQGIFRYPYLVRKKYPKDPERVSIVKAGRLFRGVPIPVLADESHREEVELTDRRFELLARSPSCKVEAIRLKGTGQYGLQFHLERSGEHGVEIMRNFYSIVARNEKS
jgi:GMP synthase-like glutamine amidotransferase